MIEGECPEGARVGRLNVQRPIGCAPSERELLDYLVAPLVRRLRHVVGAKLVRT